MARIFFWKSGSWLWHHDRTRCGRISASSRISLTLEGLIAWTCPDATKAVASDSRVQIVRVKPNS
jgi:hypothetical protein